MCTKVNLDQYLKELYDVYSQRFGVELYKMKKFSFQHCVKALRDLNDPTLGAEVVDIN